MRRSKTNIERGFVHLLPLFLLAAFAITTFVIVGAASKRSQVAEIRSEAAAPGDQDSCSGCAGEGQAWSWNKKRGECKKVGSSACKTSTTESKDTPKPTAKVSSKDVDKESCTGCQGEYLLVWDGEEGVCKKRENAQCNQLQNQQQAQANLENACPGICVTSGSCAEQKDASGNSLNLANAKGNCIKGDCCARPVASVPTTTQTGTPTEKVADGKCTAPGETCASGISYFDTTCAVTETRCGTKTVSTSTGISADSARYMAQGCAYQYPNDAQKRQDCINGVMARVTPAPVPKPQTGACSAGESSGMTSSECLGRGGKSRIPTGGSAGSVCCTLPSSYAAGTISSTITPQPVATAALIASGISCGGTTGRSCSNCDKQSYYSDNKGGFICGIRPVVTATPTLPPQIISTVPTPTLATSGPTCGGYARGACVRADTNRWVRCTQEAGRSYPVLRDDPTCAPTVAYTVGIGGQEVELQVGLGVEGPGFDDYVACQNSALQGVGCSAGGPYGSCSEGPSGKTYVCTCDAKRGYRFPVLKVIEAQNECGQLPAPVQIAANQYIEQLRKEEERRQQEALEEAQRAFEEQLQKNPELLALADDSEVRQECIRRQTTDQQERLLCLNAQALQRFRLQLLTENAPQILADTESLRTYCAAYNQGSACSATQLEDFRNDLRRVIPATSVAPNEVAATLRAQGYHQNYITAWEEYKRTNPTASFEDFQKFQQEEWEAIATTVQNMGVVNEDYIQKIQTGEYVPSELAENLSELTTADGIFDWGAHLTNTVIFFNNVTGGATKRGNDIYNAAKIEYEENNCAEKKLPNGTWADETCRLISANMSRGTLMSAAAPAAAAVGVLAIPLAIPFAAPIIAAAPLVTAVTFGGTGLGVAGTTLSLQQSAEACVPGQPITKDCAFALGNTAFAAGSTAFGVWVGGAQLAQITAQARLAQKGYALSQSADEVLSLWTRATVSQATGQAAQLQTANRVFSAVSTGWFGTQAVDTCFGEDANTTACLVNAAMTVASLGRLVGSSVNTAGAARQFNVGSDVVDVGTNIGQSVITCVGARDAASCSQALAGAAISAGGLGLNFAHQTAGARANLSDSPTAQYESTRLALQGLYDPQTGVLRAGVTTDQVTQAETALRTSILALSQEQAAVELALRPVTADIQGFLLTRQLLQAQQEFKLAQTAYETVSSRPWAEVATSPEFAAFQQARDRLVATKAVVAQADLAMRDISVGAANQRREEYLRFVESREEFRRVAQTSDASSLEYQRALAELVALRPAVEALALTPKQQEYASPLSEKQQALTDLQVQARQAQEEAAILADPTRARTLIDAATQQQQLVAQRRGLLGNGDVSFDRALGWIADGSNAVPDFVSGKYRFDSQNGVWVRLSDGAPVDQAIVVTEQNARVAALRAQLDAQIASLNNRIPQLVSAEALGQRAAAGDGAANTQIFEAQRRATQLTEQARTVAKEATGLAQAQEQARGLMGRVREAFGRLPTVEAVLSRANLPDITPSQARRAARIDEAIAREVARRGITDPAEVARLRAEIQAGIDAQPTIRERARTFFLGNEAEPTLLGRIVRPEARDQARLSALGRNYQDGLTGRVQYRGELVALDANSIRLGRSMIEADGAQVRTGSRTIDISSVRTIDDLKNVLTAAGAREGRYILTIDGEQVSVLYEQGNIFFDAKSVLTLAGNKLRLPDDVVRLKYRLWAAENLSPTQRQTLDRINTELAAFENRLASLTEGKLSRTVTDPTTGITRKEGIIQGIRGIEAGERNQMQVVADAILAQKGRGILFEALTGSGKTAILIPEIAALKAKLTGRDVFTVLNTSGDLRNFVENYVDLPSGKPLAELTIAELKAAEAKLSAVLGERVIILDGQRTRTPGELTDGRIFLTTKDVIFESIRGAEADAIMSKVQGATLLSDEAQLSLRLDVDYVISHGERVRLGASQEGQGFIDRFNRVLEEDSILKRALDHVTDAERMGLAGDYAGARAQIDEARRLLVIEPVPGERVRIGDVAIENQLYADMLRQAAESSGNPEARAYIEREFGTVDPAKAQDYQGRVLAFLNSETIPGIPRDALNQVRTEFYQRKTAAEAIVDQLGKVAGTDFTAEEGKVVLADTGNISGRTPSRAYDALALEVIGAKLIRATTGENVTVNPQDVSVTSASVSTNYAQFLKSFPEIYGFTGTPDYVAGQFKTIYGIELGVSGVKQADFVLGAAGLHKPESFRAASGIGDLGSVHQALSSERGGSQIEHVAIATGREASRAIINELRAANPGVDIIIRNPNGRHELIPADGTPPRALGDLGEVDGAIETYRTGANQGRRLITVYEYGAHYGVDSVTLATEPFTVIVGEDTTLTTFLQAAGRDRGRNGGYSRLDVVGLGLKPGRFGGASIEEQITNARTFFTENENTFIARNEIAALKRVAENLGPSILAAVEDAAGNRVFGITAEDQVRVTSFFDQVQAELRVISEIDPNIGSGKISARQDILDSVNRVHRFLQSVASRPDFASLPAGAQRVFRALVNTGRDAYTLADLTRPAGQKAAENYIPLNNLHTLDEFVATVRNIGDPAMLELLVARGGAPQVLDLASSVRAANATTLSSEGSVPPGAIGDTSSSIARTSQAESQPLNAQTPIQVAKGIIARGAAYDGQIAPLVRKTLFTGYTDAAAQIAASQQALDAARAALGNIQQGVPHLYPLNTSPSLVLQAGDRITRADGSDILTLPAGFKLALYRRGAARGVEIIDQALPTLRRGDRLFILESGLTPNLDMTADEQAAIGFEEIPAEAIAVRLEQNAVAEAQAQKAVVETEAILAQQVQALVALLPAVESDIVVRFISSAGLRATRADILGQGVGKVMLEKLATLEQQAFAKAEAGEMVDVVTLPEFTPAADAVRDFLTEYNAVQPDEAKVDTSPIQVASYIRGSVAPVLAAASATQPTIATTTGARAQSIRTQIQQWWQQARTFVRNAPRSLRAWALSDARRGAWWQGRPAAIRKTLSSWFAGLTRSRPTASPAPAATITAPAPAQTQPASAADRQNPFVAMRQDFTKALGDLEVRFPAFRRWRQARLTASAQARQAGTGITRRTDGWFFGTLNSRPNQTRWWVTRTLIPTNILSSIIPWWPVRLVVQIVTMPINFVRNPLLIYDAVRVGQWVWDGMPIDVIATQRFQPAGPVAQEPLPPIETRNMAIKDWLLGKPFAALVASPRMPNWVKNTLGGQHEGFIPYVMNAIPFGRAGQGIPARAFETFVYYISRTVGNLLGGTPLVNPFLIWDGLRVSRWAAERVTGEKSPIRIDTPARAAPPVASGVIPVRPRKLQPIAKLLTLSPLKVHWFNSAAALNLLALQKDQLVSGIDVEVPSLYQPGGVVNGKAKIPTETGLREQAVRVYYKPGLRPSLFMLFPFAGGITRSMWPSDVAVVVELNAAGGETDTFHWVQVGRIKVPTPVDKLRAFIAKDPQWKTHAATILWEDAHGDEADARGRLTTQLSFFVKNAAELAPLRAELTPEQLNQAIDALVGEFIAEAKNNPPAEPPVSEPEPPTPPAPPAAPAGFTPAAPVPPLSPPVSLEEQEIINAIRPQVVTPEGVETLRGKLNDLEEQRALLIGTIQTAEDTLRQINVFKNEALPQALAEARQRLATAQARERQASREIQRVQAGITQAQQDITQRTAELAQLASEPTSLRGHDVGTAEDVGTKYKDRKNPQEDAVAVITNSDPALARLGSALMIEADGMGGMGKENAGAVAAQLIKRRAADIYFDEIPLPPSGAIDIGARLKETVRRLNQEIRNADLAGGGAVLDLVVILQEGERQFAHIAHTGDTETWLIRGKTAYLLTRDHSPVGELLNQGQLTIEEAGKHPEKNKVYNALTGESDDIDGLEIRRFEVVAGDTILSVSDGVIDPLRWHNRIFHNIDFKKAQPGGFFVEAVSAAKGASQIATYVTRGVRQLANKIKQGVSVDNITAGVLIIGAPSGPSTDAQRQALQATISQAQRTQAKAQEEIRTLTVAQQRAHTQSAEAQNVLTALELKNPDSEIVRLQGDLTQYTADLALLENEITQVQTLVDEAQQVAQAQVEIDAVLARLNTAGFSVEAIPLSRQLLDNSLELGRRFTSLVRGILDENQAKITILEQLRQTLADALPPIGFLRRAIDAAGVWSQIDTAIQEAREREEDEKAIEPPSPIVRPEEDFVRRLEELGRVPNEQALRQLIDEWNQTTIGQDQPYVYDVELGTANLNYFAFREHVREVLELIPAEDQQEAASEEEMEEGGIAPISRARPQKEDEDDELPPPAPPSAQPPIQEERFSPIALLPSAAASIGIRTDETIAALFSIPQIFPYAELFRYGGVLIAAQDELEQNLVDGLRVAPELRAARAKVANVILAYHQNEAQNLFAEGEHQLIEDLISEAEDEFERYGIPLDRVGIRRTLTDAQTKGTIAFLKIEWDMLADQIRALDPAAIVKVPELTIASLNAAIAIARMLLLPPPAPAVQRIIVTEREERQRLTGGIQNSIDALTGSLQAVTVLPGVRGTWDAVAKARETLEANGIEVRTARGGIPRTPASFMRELSRMLSERSLLQRVRNLEKLTAIAGALDALQASLNTWVSQKQEEEAQRLGDEARQEYQNLQANILAFEVLVKTVETLTQNRTDLQPRLENLMFALAGNSDTPYARAYIDGAHYTRQNELIREALTKEGITDVTMRSAGLDPSAVVTTVRQSLATLLYSDRQAAAERRQIVDAMLTEANAIDFSATVAEFPTMTRERGLAIVRELQLQEEQEVESQAELAAIQRQFEEVQRQEELSALKQAIIDRKAAYLEAKEREEELLAQQRQQMQEVVLTQNQVERAFWAIHPLKVLRGRVGNAAAIGVVPWYELPARLQAISFALDIQREVEHLRKQNLLTTAIKALDVASHLDDASTRLLQQSQREQHKRLLSDTFYGNMDSIRTKVEELFLQGSVKKGQVEDVVYEATLGILQSDQTLSAAVSGPLTRAYARVVAKEAAEQFIHWEEDMVEGVHEAVIEAVLTSAQRQVYNRVKQKIWGTDGLSAFHVFPQTLLEQRLNPHFTNNLTFANESGLKQITLRALPLDVVRQWDDAAVRGFEALAQRIDAYVQKTYPEFNDIDHPIVVRVISKWAYEQYTSGKFATLVEAEELSVEAEALLSAAAPRLLADEQVRALSSRSFVRLVESANGVDEEDTALVELVGQKLEQYIREAGIGSYLQSKNGQVALQFYASRYAQAAEGMNWLLTNVLSTDAKVAELTRRAIENLSSEEFVQQGLLFRSYFYALLSSDSGGVQRFVQAIEDNENIYSFELEEVGTVNVDILKEHLSFTDRTFFDTKLYEKLGQFSLEVADKKAETLRREGLFARAKDLGAKLKRVRFSSAQSSIWSIGGKPLSQVIREVADSLSSANSFDELPSNIESLLRLASFILTDARLVSVKDAQRQSLAVRIAGKDVVVPIPGRLTLRRWVQVDTGKRSVFPDSESPDSLSVRFVEDGGKRYLEFNVDAGGQKMPLIRRDIDAEIAQLQPGTSKPRRFNISTAFFAVVGLITGVGGILGTYISSSFGSNVDLPQLPSIIPIVQDIGSDALQEEFGLTGEALSLPEQFLETQPLQQVEDVNAQRAAVQAELANATSYFDFMTQPYFDQVIVPQRRQDLSDPNRQVRTYGRELSAEEIETAVTSPVVHIVLLGTDLSTDYWGDRTWAQSRGDLVVDVYINFETGHATIVNINRRFLLADGYEVNGEGNFINEIPFSISQKIALPGVDEQNLEESPLLNTELRFEAMTGIPVDGVTMINFDGFKTIIDRLYKNGMTLEIPFEWPRSTGEKDTRGNTIYETMPAGTYTMTPEEVLTFIRVRKGEEEGVDARDKKLQLVMDLLVDRIVNDMLINSLLAGNPEPAFNKLEGIFQALLAKDKMITSFDWFSGDPTGENSGLLAWMEYQDALARQNIDPATYFAKAMETLNNRSITMVRIAAQRTYGVKEQEGNTYYILQPYFTNFIPPDWTTRCSHVYCRGDGVWATGEWEENLAQHPEAMVEVREYYQFLHKIIERHLPGSVVDINGETSLNTNGIFLGGMSLFLARGQAVVGITQEVLAAAFQKKKEIEVAQTAGVQKGYLETIRTFWADATRQWRHERAQMFLNRQYYQNHLAYLGLVYTGEAPGDRELAVEAWLAQKDKYLKNIPLEFVRFWRKKMQELDGLLLQRPSAQTSKQVSQPINQVIGSGPAQVFENWANKYIYNRNPEARTEGANIGMISEGVRLWTQDWVDIVRNRLIIKNGSQTDSTTLEIAKSTGGFYQNIVDVVMDSNMSLAQKEEEINNAFNTLPPHVKSLYEQGKQMFLQELKYQTTWLNEHKGTELEDITNLILDEHPNLTSEAKAEILKATRENVQFLETYPGLPLLVSNAATYDLWQKHGLVLPQAAATAFISRDNKALPSFIFVRKGRLVQETNASQIRHEAHHLLWLMIERSGFARASSGEGESQDAFRSFRDEMIAYLLEFRKNFDIGHVGSDVLIYNKNPDFLREASAAKNQLQLLVSLGTAGGLSPEDFIYPVAKARNYEELIAGALDVAVSVPAPIPQAITIIQHQRALDKRFNVNDFSSQQLDNVAKVARAYQDRVRMNVTKKDFYNLMGAQAVRGLFSETDLSYSVRNVNAEAQKLSEVATNHFSVPVTKEELVRFRLEQVLIQWPIQDKKMALSYLLSKNEQQDYFIDLKQWTTPQLAANELVKNWAYKILGGRSVTDEERIVVDSLEIKQIVLPNLQQIVEEVIDAAIQENGSNNPRIDILRSQKDELRKKLESKQISLSAALRPQAVLDSLKFAWGKIRPVFDALRNRLNQVIVRFPAESLVSQKENTPSLSLHKGIIVEGLDEWAVRGDVTVGQVKSILDKLPEGYAQLTHVNKIVFEKDKYFAVRRNGETVVVREDEILSTDSIQRRLRGITEWNSDAQGFPTDGGQTIRIFSTQDWEGENDTDVALYTIAHEFGHATWNAIDPKQGPVFWAQLINQGKLAPFTIQIPRLQNVINEWKKLSESTLPRYLDYKKDFLAEGRYDNAQEAQWQEDFATAHEYFLYWNNLKDLDIARFNLLDIGYELLGELTTTPAESAVGTTISQEEELEEQSVQQSSGLIGSDPARYTLIL